MKNDLVVAIAGVTGAVGAEFIATMDRRRFPVGKLKALASAARSLCGRPSPASMAFGGKIALNKVEQGALVTQ